MNKRTTKDANNALHDCNLQKVKFVAGITYDGTRDARA